MEWFIDGETGLPAEAAEKVKKKLREYEAEKDRLTAENQMLKNRIQELEATIANIIEKVARIEQKIK